MTILYGGVLVMDVQMKRIGVLTGGGDCAGLNPAMKWVVKTAMEDPMSRSGQIHFEVVGIHDGWKGLYEVNPDDPASRAKYIEPLDPDKVRTWDRQGGTMLGTSRFGPYSNIVEKTSGQSKKVIENIRHLGLEAIIVLGGNGTLSVAEKLFEEGVKLVGIPKTIDRDLMETDYTLGFDTALNVITEEVDRLRTTAGSHKRIFVVETMGRSAGWLALEGGEACGAYIILIPECPYDIDKVCELVSKGQKHGNRYEIIVVAEAARTAVGKEIVKKIEADAFGHLHLGGAGEYVASEIQKRTGQETKSIELSYLQRGGAPSAYDRRMGRHFGIAAVDLIANNNFGRMVCLKNGKVSSVPLSKVVNRTNMVDINTEYDCERYNGRRTILIDGSNKTMISDKKIFDLYNDEKIDLSNKKEPAEKHNEKAPIADKHDEKATIVGFARGLCIGIALTFFSLSIYAFTQHNNSYALGFLGPAIAALVGVWGFRISRFSK
jgi:6-phosphofructokinase 1